MDFSFLSHLIFGICLVIIITITFNSFNFDISDFFSLTKISFFTDPSASPTIPPSSDMDRDESSLNGTVFQNETTTTNNTNTTVPTGSTNTSSPTSRNIFAAYYPSWIFYKNEYPIDYIDYFDILTHLNYAFFRIDPKTGEVSLGDPWADTGYPIKEEFFKSQNTNLPSVSKSELQANPPTSSNTYSNTNTEEIQGNLGYFLKLKERFPNISYGMSIGGWTYRDQFSPGLEDSVKREKAVRSIIDLMKKYKFTYVDIDWEFPDTTKDVDNLLALLKLLKKNLDLEFGTAANERRYITLAVSAFVVDKFNKVGNGAKFILSQMKEFVDLFFVMTYDYNGPWSKVTGHNAPFAGTESTTTQKTIETNGTITNSTKINGTETENEENSGSSAESHFIKKDIQSLLNVGWPSSKIVLGIPLYGRRFFSTKGIGQPFKNDDGDENNPEFSPVIDNKYLTDNLLQSMELKWDGKSNANYYYSNKKKEVISFESMKAISLKLDFCKQKKLRGIFFWEMTADFPFNHPNNTISKTWRLSKEKNYL